MLLRSGTCYNVLNFVFRELEELKKMQDFTLDKLERQMNLFEYILELDRLNDQETFLLSSELESIHTSFIGQTTYDPYDFDVFEALELCTKAIKKLNSDL